MEPWPSGTQITPTSAETFFRSERVSVFRAEQEVHDCGPWTEKRKISQQRQKMDMVTDAGTNRLYRAPGESGHQWVWIDLSWVSAENGHELGRKRVLHTSHAWERVAGFSSRQILFSPLISWLWSFSVKGVIFGIKKAGVTPRLNFGIMHYLLIFSWLL